MRYSTSNPVEAIRAQTKLEWLISNGKEIELTEKRKKRTYKQNRYLHLILTYFGICIGYSLAEIKDVWKRDICPDIFEYEKNGAVFVRSSADLKTDEMAKAISKLKRRAATEGHPLPDAENVEMMNWIEQEINRYENYQYT